MAVNVLGRLTLGLKLVMYLGGNGRDADEKVKRQAGKAQY